jgi:hypothetical protein
LFKTLSVAATYGQSNHQCGRTLTANGGDMAEPAKPTARSGLRTACLIVGWLLIAAGVVSAIGALFDGNGSFALFDIGGVAVGAVLVWAGRRIFDDER